MTARVPTFDEHMAQLRAAGVLPPWDESLSYEGAHGIGRHDMAAWAVEVFGTPEAEAVSKQARVVRALYPEVSE